MQELEVAFYVRRELWSFVQLDAVLHDMEVGWAVGQGSSGAGWSEHRYVISRQGGDEDTLAFVLRREQPLPEMEAAATLRQLEEIVRKHFPIGSRLWRAAESSS
ncbi:MAG TPA: hypothetical protein VK821_04960 [Dehalococcoidia bacterium]|nr:hypothetical protein [Dehalococcoidia bacterium]